MRAVAMLLHTQLRQHWKSWLAFAALVTLVGGLVMAAAATGRRTAAAFPGFVARHGYDAVVYSSHPLPSLARIPQVAHVTPAPGPITVGVRCASCRKPIDLGSFGVFEVPPADLGRMVKLLSGRMPDQSRPDEVLASYTLARDNGVHLGSVIQVLTPTPAQVRAAQELGPSKVSLAAVPRHSLRVVGLVVAENEFPAGNGPRYDLFPTKAYAAAVNHHAVMVQVYYVRLRHGTADQPAFDNQLRPLHTLGADDLDIDAAAVQRAIWPQAVGWWVLAGLAALAGLAVIGQAAARQFVTDQDDHAALSAVGVRAGQFVTLGLARAAIIGAVGAAGAVVLATALSPLTPVGEARLAAATAWRGGHRSARHGGRRAGHDGHRRRAVGLAGGAPCPAAERRPAAAAGPGAAGPGAGRDRRTAQRHDRGPARAGAWPRPPGGPGRDGAARHGDGGRRAVCHGRVRRQPDPAHQLARAVRRALPGGIHQPGNGIRGRSHRGAAGQPAAGSGDYPDHPGHGGGDRGQWAARPLARVERGPRPGPDLGRGRAAAPT